MRISPLKRIISLETIEEKSFWVIAPAVAAIGVTGLFTASFYGSSLPTIISAILCLIIPVVLMIFVYKKQNYHSAYPMLVIFIGGISVPITFVCSGGFLSGMPIFCAVCTGISSLCYSNKWRYISFVSCLLGNAIAFWYVYTYGTPFPLEGQATIYNDVIFGYSVGSIGLFFALNLITSEIRKYRVSQDVLQQYFDAEVRKEILKKALNGDLSVTTRKNRAVILFADISNFTTITENMSSDIIGEFLNEFFSIAGKCIHETNGIIDKYIGDCVMAYWFESEKENCVLSAVKAVLELRKELYQKSEMIYKKYGTELNFSCGIAFGDIIFGDIGSDTMHDYTIIGDAVNTASRIENYASSGELLLSAKAAAMVQNEVQMELVETDIYFKGKNQAVNLYRIMGLNEGGKNTVVLGSKQYGYTLYICGCRGSFPVSGLRFSEYGGETSCYIIKKGDYAIVVDCGTGLKNATDILANCKRIDILLTHVHYDHILGLLMAYPPKSADIHVYSYFDGWKTTKDTLVNFMEHPYWPIEIEHTKSVPVQLEQSIQLNEDISATFFKSDHPDDGCVIRLNVVDKNICFFADCEDVNKLNRGISRNADLLFYDGMFDDNDTVDHTGWGHGTWQKGVDFGIKQNIKRLVITHHSPEVGDHTLLQREKQARLLNKNASFAKTGDRIVI